MGFFKKLFFILLIALVIGINFVVISGYLMYEKAINKTSLSEKVKTIMDNEKYVTLDNVSEDFKNAIVSIEDHRFYDHDGIDMIGIGRAILANIKARNPSYQGGSTITQQVCKNMYLTQEKQFTRKIAEVFLAFDLESSYSKADILEIYINTIYFGNGYYGIQDASMGYYNKSPKDLDLNESSLLAGIPNAPSAYSPTKNKKLATERQKKVLEAMVKYNYISQEQMNEITSKK